MPGPSPTERGDDGHREVSRPKQYTVAPTHFSLKKRIPPPGGWENWIRSSPLGTHGLYTDMPLGILPPEFAVEIMRGMEPPDDEGTTPSQMHPALRQWDTIKALLHGWQRIGLLPTHPDVNPGTVNSWFHLVAAGSDPSDPSAPGGHDERGLATRRVERFIVEAQTLGLLPRVEGILADNPQRWLHLFVPVHDWGVIIPPSNIHSLYWRWHRVVTKRY